MSNTELCKYGIFNYNATHCIHVGFKTAMLFVYDTEQMIAHINYKKDEFQPYQKAPAFQKSIQTADGFLVPYDLFFINAINIHSIMVHYPDNEKLIDESTKSKMSINIIKTALQNNMVNFQLKAREVTDKEKQIEGQDIIIVNNIIIQVKCDWYAGPKEKGGTGNLYVQTHECNPFNKH